MNNTVVPANMYEAQNAYLRLQSCLTKDDLNTAILEIKTFLKIYPDVAMAYNDLGVLNYQAGEKLLALACYEKANRLQHGTPAVIKNLADFYLVELGWTDDAIMMLTGLLQLNPEDCEILTSLGVISERIGRANEARSFYRRVLDLDPANHQVREALASIEGPVSAAEYRQKPVAAPTPAPEIAEAPPQRNSQLGEIITRLKESVNKTQPVATINVPKNVEELYREAQLLVTNDDEETAISVLEQLIDIDPFHAVALNDLGVLYTLRGEFDKALSFHERAVSQNQTSSTFKKNLASLYYTCLGRTDEAIGIYTGLLKEYPDDVEILTALAIICKANNLLEQARTFIGKVLDLEPWDSNARDFLAGL